MHDQVGQYFRVTVVMGVTAQHGVHPVGVTSGRRMQRIGDAATNEKRGPVLVGRFAFVPAGFAKRWDVGGDQDVTHGLGQGREFTGEPFATVTTFPLQNGLPRGTRGVPEVVDQLKVVQANRGVFVITLRRVAPTVITDQHGIIAQTNRTAIGEVIQVVDLSRQVDDLSPRFADRFAVEIVVTQHEIDRAIKRLGHAAKLIRDIVAFGQISRHDQAIRGVSDQLVRPHPPGFEFGVIEMRVGDPSELGRRRGWLSDIVGMRGIDST